MSRLIQTAFNRGEISPAFYGRVNTELYQTAVRKARNMVVHNTGGISKRPGGGWIGPVGDHTYAPRLKRFQFKTTDQYELEFGDFYMRVIRDDGHVLESATATSITGATQANPVVVTAVAHPFANGDEVYITGIVGMTELNGRRFIVANKTANTFELTSQEAGANIDGTGYTAYSSGGTVTRIYEIATPYAIADVPDLVFAQSADTMTITHKDYDPYELIRTDHDAWTLTAPTFGSTATPPGGITVTPASASTTEYKYRVTAVLQSGEESLPGLDNTSATITAATQANPVVITTGAAHNWTDNDEVYIDSIVGMTELNGRRFIVVNTTATTAELLGEDGTGHTAYSSGGTATQTLTRITNGAATAKNTIAWNEVSGAERYAVYKFQNGAWGLIGESEGLSFLDDNITADSTLSFPRSRNPFRGATAKPAAVSFYEQRRVFGGSYDYPDTEFFSQVGSYSNMNVSSPSLDSDAITASLASLEVNEIRHFVPLNDLLVFTSGAEWKINSGDNSFFGASTIKQKPQSYWGCSLLPPIVVGGTALFVDSTYAKVRSLGWSFQQDSYTGVDLSFLAQHLFKGYSIVDWTMQRSPETRIFVVRNDGVMLTLTYDGDQQTVAWTTWDTDGDYEAVDALRGGGATGEDSIYAVVKRTINGNTVRYIEVYRDRHFDDVRDAYYVDCGLTYDAPITIEGISLANPVVITATGHGLSNGDEVELSDIEWAPDYDATFTATQPDQLNYYRYIVTNKTANTFELYDTGGTAVDGSAYNAWKKNGVVRLAVTQVSGLWHLEGETLDMLVDGNVVSTKTVSNGAVTLDRSSTRIHAGLRFIADLETLNVEAHGGETIQGAMTKIPKVTVRFQKSRGMFIGPDETKLVEMKQRQFEKYGEPTRLLTGDKEVTLLPDWNSNGRVYMRNPYPLPFTILAVVPSVYVGSDE